MPKQCAQQYRLYFPSQTAQTLDRLSRNDQIVKVEASFLVLTLIKVLEEIRGYFLWLHFEKYLRIWKKLSQPCHDFPLYLNRGEMRISSA